jgi:hypothetical protein
MTEQSKTHARSRCQRRATAHLSRNRHRVLFVTGLAAAIAPMLAPALTGSRSWTPAAQAHVVRLDAPTSFQPRSSTKSLSTDSRAFCSFREPHATITPGISMTPTRNHLTTNGETGVINCVGSINGHEVTGPGTWGVDHPIGPGPLGEATCLQSSAAGGKFLYTVPTRHGQLHVEGALAYTHVGTGGTISGQADAITFSGTFRFQPKAGNCVTTPVTAVTVEGNFMQVGLTRATHTAEPERGREPP